MPATQWPFILLLGDSQTQEGYSEEGCWVSILSDHFQRKCDVINRGFTGYNSRWVKMILPEIISKDYMEACAAVIILLGSNDANLETVSPNHHIPLQEYRENLIDLCVQLQKRGVSQEKIILVTPPPVDEQLWSDQCKKEGRESGLNNRVMRMYAEACLMAAEDSGVDSLDMFADFIHCDSWKTFVNVDGLHIAKAGGQRLASLLINKLEKLTSRLKQLYPDYDRVDNSNPTLKP